MKPVTYDFDVITDAPAPQRRKPELPEQPPRAEVEEEARRRAAPVDQDARDKIRAAE
jgi:hypothetical protein